VSYFVWWILLGIPLIAVFAAWLGLFVNWKPDPQTIFMASVIVFPTVSTLLACGGLMYVQFGGTLGSRKVEDWGLLLALAGAALGLAVSLAFRRWFSTLAFGASTWMLLLFLLMGVSD
jgi:hypothetical protein